jgi:hypothetical protein
VVGQDRGVLLDRIDPKVLDRRGQGVVQGAAAGGAELGHQRAPHDVVGEAVAVGVLLDHQARRQRGVEGVEQGAAGQPRGLGHHVEVEPGSGDRRGAQEVGRARVEPGHPGRHQLLHSGRDLAARTQHLGDQERVARGLGHQPAGGGGVGPGVARGAQASHQLQHLGLGQAPQRQPPHPAVAVERQHDVTQGVAGLQVVVAGDGHHQHGRVARMAHQVAHEQQGVVVGPLEVVEDQQHRAFLGRRRHQVGHRPEQPGTAVGARRPAGGVQRWQHRRQLGPRLVAQRGQLAGRGGGHVAVQCLHQRLIGDDRLLVAPPEQQEPAPLAHPAGDLGREPRLADPGLAGHHHDVAGAAHCLVPRLRQRGQLGLAADERRRGGSGRGHQPGG